MVRKPLTFIQALPLGRSKREQELEQAKARSHTAKVVHQRGKSSNQENQTLNFIPAEQHEPRWRERGPRQVFTRAVTAACIEDLAEDHLAKPYNSQIFLLQRHKPPACQSPVRDTSGFIPSILSPRQGNSDPFDTFPVVVSSKINQIMTYAREIYLPATMQDALDLTPVVKSRDWTEVVKYLQDESTAYAHLARVAAFIAPLGQQNGNPEVSTQFLIFKSKGTRLLRQRIENGMVDQTTIQAMSCFHCADVYARDYTAARLHARMLITLFRREDIPIDHNLLQWTVNHDAQMAVMILARPSFDVEGWISETFALYFTPVVDDLPIFLALEAMDGDVHESVDDAKLRDIIVRIRHCLGLYLLGLQDLAYATHEHKLFIRHVVNISFNRLVNHYLDAREYLTQCPSGSVASGHFHVQEYASLATLLWLRKVTGASDAKVTESYIVFDADGLLKTRLKEAMEDSEWMKADIALEKYAGIRLWALYVGAYLEQVDAVRSGIPGGASMRWFNRRLACQAQAMGLMLWQQIREVLQGFLHTDAIMPHGSIWFLDTMEANLTVPT